MEAKKKLFNKQYAAKFQFIINNYGYIMSKLPVDMIQDEDLIEEVRQSLQHHIEQFGLYVWKDVRSLLKKIQTAEK